MKTNATIFQDADVLLIGQGPSAWKLRESIWWPKVHSLPNVVTVACNRAHRGPNPAPRCCFALDARMAFEVLDDRVFDRCTLFISRRDLQNYTLSGRSLPPGAELDKNLVLASGAAGGGQSTGVGAFRSILWGSPRSITLIGFDGSTDPRNRFEGEPGYENKPSASSFRRWEQVMVGELRLVRMQRDVMVFLVRANGDIHHPLAASGEVVEIFAEEEEMRWQMLARHLQELGGRPSKSSRSTATAGR